MHSQGYIKLYRKICDNELWTGERFTRGQAWVDLLMLANHRDGYIRKRGIKVVVNRGDMAWSENELANRWRWSRGKVRRFLKELCSGNDPFLIQQNGQQKKNVTSLYQIVKYELYQGNGTTEQTTDGQQTDNRRYRNNNDKNEKNKNNTPRGEYKFLLKDNSVYRPAPDFIADLERLYPNVDFKREFAAIEAWCLSNPSKRKTARGATKFVNSWMSRAEEREVSAHQQSRPAYKIRTAEDAHELFD